MAQDNPFAEFVPQQEDNPFAEFLPAKKKLGDISAPKADFSDVQGGHSSTAPEMVTGYISKNATFVPDSAPQKLLREGYRRDEPQVPTGYADSEAGRALGIKRNFVSSGFDPELTPVPRELTEREKLHLAFAGVDKLEDRPLWRKAIDSFIDTYDDFTNGIVRGGGDVANYPSGIIDESKLQEAKRVIAARPEGGYWVGNAKAPIWVPVNDESVKEALKTITDVSIGTAERTQASQQLAKEYPVGIENTEDIDAAKGLLGKGKAMLMNPIDTFTNKVVPSMVSSVPVIVASAASRNPMLLSALGGSGVAYAQETATGIGDYLSSIGVDTSNPDAVEAALKDQSILAAAIKYTDESAAIVGGASLLSGGLAGKSLAPSAIKGALPRAGADIAQQFLAGGVIDAGGEAGKQVRARGDITDPESVLLEAFSGGVESPVSALGRITSEYQNSQDVSNASTEELTRRFFDSKNNADKMAAALALAQRGESIDNATLNKRLGDATGSNTNKPVNSSQEDRAKRQEKRNAEIAKLPYGAINGKEFTVNDSMLSDEPVTVQMIVDPGGSVAAMTPDGQMIDVTGMAKAGFSPEKMLATALGRHQQNETPDESKVIPAPSPPVGEATADQSQPSKAMTPSQVEPTADLDAALAALPKEKQNETGRNVTTESPPAGNPAPTNSEATSQAPEYTAPTEAQPGVPEPTAGNAANESVLAKQSPEGVNRLAELETKSDTQDLSPDESVEYVKLLKADRTAGKVGGRVMPGIRNSTAYTQAKDAGQLKPVQTFLDADNFKRINDELNHDAGDEAIAQIGQALFDELGEGNVFHRSGDEFIVQGDDPAVIDAAMTRARDRLSKAKLQVTLPDGTVIERTGIGFSYGSGKDITEAENAQRTDKQNRAAAGLRTERRADSGRVDSGADQAPVAGRPQESQSNSDVAAEVTPTKFTTSTKNEVTDAEREAAGRDPIEKSTPRSNEETLASAKSVLEKNPSRGKELVEKLKNDGVQSISSEDEAVLLIEKTDLINKRNDAADRVSDPKATEEQRTVAKREWEAIEDQINDLDQATHNSGSEWGRLGQFRQRMLREDFTFAALERKERVREGRPLTADESAKLKVMAERIAEPEDKYNTTKAALEAAEAKANGEVTYQELLQEMGKAIGRQAPRNVINIDAFKARADAARAKLAALDDVGNSKKKNQAGAVINPVAFVYLAEIGAFHIANGVNEIGKFIQVMKADLGDKYDQYKSAIKDIYKASKLQAQGLKDEKAKKAPDPIDPENLTHKDVYDLARQKVQEGVHGEAAVMKAVHDDLVKIIPDITERDVRRLFSEYGKAKFPSKDADKKELREIRALVQMQESIDRIASGLDAMKSGVQRDQATQLMRDKRKQLNAMLKSQEKKTVASPEKLATYQQTRANNLRNQIEDLEKQIKTGEKPAKTPAPVPNMEVVKLIAERDALRKQLDEINAPPKKTDEERYQQTRATSLARQLKEIEERLAKQDYSKRVKPVRILNDANTQAAFELAKAKEAFLRHQFISELEKRSALGKILGTIGQTLHLSRALMTSLDLSAVFRQGGILALSRPVKAAESIVPMLKAFASEKAAFEVSEEIGKRKNASLYKKAGLELTEEGAFTLAKAEELFMARWIEKSDKVEGQPVRNALKTGKDFVLTPIRGSQRAYVTFLNKLRADVFDSLTASLSLTVEPTLEEITAIANYINIATGRGKIGLKNEAAGHLNMVFFAPRLVASRFNYLAGQPIYGGTARTRTLIMQEYARFATGVSIVMALGYLAFLASAGDDEEDDFISLDARSSDFLKMRFGDTRIDPLAGLSQMSVFLTREFLGETVDKAGNPIPLRDNYRLLEAYRDPLDREGVKFGSRTTGSEIGRFMRSKLAPVPGALVTLLTGTDAIGRDMTPLQVGQNLVTPMSFQNVANVMEAHGVPAGTAITTLELLGMGVNHYSSTESAEREAFKTEYEKLTEEVDSVKTSLDERMAALPKSEWPAEFEKLKQQHPRILSGVVLDTYKNNGKFGKVGELKQTKDGKPKLKYTASEGGSVLGELEGYTAYDVYQKKEVTGSGIQDNVRALNSVINNIEKDDSLTVGKLRAYLQKAPIDQAIADPIDLSGDEKRIVKKSDVRKIIDFLAEARRKEKRRAMEVIKGSETASL